MNTYLDGLRHWLADTDAIRPLPQSSLQDGLTTSRLLRAGPQERTALLQGQSSARQLLLSAFEQSLDQQDHSEHDQQHRPILPQETQGSKERTKHRKQDHTDHQ